jgi:hypothetical protein
MVAMVPTEILAIDFADRRLSAAVDAAKHKRRRRMPVARTVNRAKLAAGYHAVG